MKLRNLCAVLALTLAVPSVFAQDEMSEAQRMQMLRAYALQGVMGLGMLPAMQQACGHTPQQKSRVQSAVKRYEQTLVGQFGADMSGDYRKAVDQGRNVFDQALKSADAAAKSKMCTQLNESFEKTLGQLEAQMAAQSAVHAASSASAAAARPGSSASAPAKKKAPKPATAAASKA